MKTNDVKLMNAVVAAKGGNQDAFTYLYESTFKSKYYIALKLMNNEYDAQDVLQIAYTQAFKNLHTLENPASFSPWLSQIVNHTALNVLKKKRPQLFSDMVSENEEGGRMGVSASG